MTVPGKSRRLRLVVVHPSDELYGSDRVLIEALPVLGAADAEVWLPRDLPYTGLLSERLQAQGFVVRRVSMPILRRAYMNPRGLLSLVAASISLLREFRRCRPQSVYVSTTACAPSAVLARLVGASVLVHVHELWDRTERFLVGPMLLAAGRVIVVSDSVRSALPRYVRARAVLVENGVGRQMAVDPPVSERRASLTFVVASRWNSWKGHETLLRAWRQADMQDARLLILGGPPLSGGSTDVPALVSELELGDQVVILGEVEEAGPLIDSADVVLVPSLKEPSGLVAIEAGRGGKAAMVSRTGGLAEIIRDGATGWLVTPGDVDAWSSALKGVTRALANELGGHAQSVYARQYTGDAFRRRIRPVVDSWLTDAIRGRPR